jgi:hypothetical protein
MNRRKSIFIAAGFGAIVAFIGLAPATAKALPLTWNVDPTSSYIRLTIPDQDLVVPDVGNVKLLMRDANSSTQWTDAGGRRASLDGEIATDYMDGTSIRFLGGSHNLYALETTSLRPNPAQWSAATTNYTGTSTALAALGGRVRGTVTIILPITFDAAFVAFRSVRLDLTNATSGSIAITSGTFAGNTTRCGIASALADVDGLEVLSFGQPIPDVLHGQLDPVVQQNAAGGTIANLGGLNRKLTYTINVPNLSIDLSGTVVTGSAAGQIVAYATLPEPPTLRIARSTNATVVVAWPATVTGFLLEKNSTLGTTNWATVTNSPVTVGAEKQVRLPASGSGTFYRLRSQ